MFDQSVGPGLFVRLGLDAAGLITGLDEAKGRLTKFSAETNQSTRTMADLGIAIAVVGSSITSVGTAFYVATQKYGGMAQQLRDLSYSTGVSTDQLQKMQYAAVLAGTDFSRVSFGLNQLSLSMANAKDPTSAAYKAFMGLGIDPRGKTVDQVFDLTTSALVDMRDETSRNQSAMDLYGRSWKDLLPYMQTYIDKSKEIEGHPRWSKEDIQNLEDMKTGMDDFSFTIEKTAGKIYSKLIPALKLIHVIPMEEEKKVSQNAPLGPEDYPWAAHPPFLGEFPLSLEELVARGTGIVEARSRDKEQRARVLQNVYDKGGLTNAQAANINAFDKTRGLLPSSGGQTITIAIQNMNVTDGKDFAIKAREEFERNQRNSRRALGYPDVT